MAAALMDLDRMALPLPAYLTEYSQVDMLGMWYRFVDCVRIRQLCRSMAETLVDLRRIALPVSDDGLFIS